MMCQTRVVARADHVARQRSPSRRGGEADARRACSARARTSPATTASGTRGARWRSPAGGPRTSRRRISRAPCGDGLGAHGVAALASRLRVGKTDVVREHARRAPTGCASAPRRQSAARDAVGGSPSGGTASPGRLELPRKRTAPSPTASGPGRGASAARAPRGQRARRQRPRRPPRQAAANTSPRRASITASTAPRGSRAARASACSVETPTSSAPARLRERAGGGDADPQAGEDARPDARRAIRSTSSAARPACASACLEQRRAAAARAAGARRARGRRGARRPRRPSASDARDGRGRRRVEAEDDAHGAVARSARRSPPRVLEPDVCATSRSPSGASPAPRATPRRRSLARQIVGSSSAGSSPASPASR